MQQEAEKEKNFQGEVSPPKESNRSSEEEHLKLLDQNSHITTFNGI